MEMWYDKNNDRKNLRKEDFMRKKIWSIATALTLAVGCSLFVPHSVWAADTQDIQQDDDNYIMINGKKFQTLKTLKNGKTLRYYNIETYNDSKLFSGMMEYDGEQFKFQSYSLDLNKADIENPEYDDLDKSTQKFQVYEKPEEYFPALTATKKVNELINKYKDPSQHLLPEKVDKTSTTYQEMKTAAEEATKNCKTDYEKIVALAMYVKSIMTYDISLKDTILSVEKAWAMKKGVCADFAAIMERLVQIEGIPSVSVGWENKNNYFIGHAYVLSYDKVSKKWICSDPTNGLKDLDVYSQAGQMTNVDQNVAYLKKDDGLFFLTYDKNDAYGNIDYDTWELIDRWGIVLHDADYSNGTDISITSTDFDGIPIVGVSENAFHNDTQITSLSLPSSVEKVESGAFWKTSNLKNITFADKGKGLKSLEMYAFADCSSLESIDLSNANLTEIPEKAFENCTSLRSVKLPPTVTKIDVDAFSGCRNLEEITGLSDCSITEIGTDAFYGCSKLKSLDFSNSTFTALPEKAFSGLRSLTTLTVPKTLTTVGAQAFSSCEKIEEVTGLSDCNITSLGESAFASCTNLKRADLSKSSFTVLPARAFYQDTALSFIKMPSVLKEIGKDALYGCESISKLDLTDTALTTIGEYGLGGMRSLMYIDLPDTVNSVGANAFDLTWRMDASDTALLPTVVSENVKPDAVGYTENNKSPWKRRYVVFRDDAYAVYFDGNGSDGKTVNDPVFGSTGTKLSIPACKYTKKGYLFKEWNTKKDGSGASYKAGAKTLDAVSILYAQWQKATAKVTLEFPGGKYTNASGSRWEDRYSFTASFSSTSSVTYLPFAQNMTKEGYTFAGWYTEPEYKKKVESLTIRTAIDGMTLYAKWNDTHEHVWGEGTITTKPACITPGVKTYTCSVCQKTKTEEIPATGHLHTEVRNKAEATCTTEGYTGDTYCTDCGEKLSSGEPTAKKAHDWDEGKVTTEATCKNTGVKTYTCNNCSETKTEVIPMTDHIWDNGKITTKPSCVTPGVKTYTCTVCQETKTEEIPATGHLHTEVRNKAEATCTTEGYTGDTYCTDCGEKLSDGKILPKKDHEYEVSEKQEATCTTDGYILSVCKVCGDEKREVLPATGHQHTEIRNKKEATCKEEGYTGDTYCKDCGEKLSDGKTIAKTTEHTWNAGKVTKAATCTEKGVKLYTCTVCDKVKTEEIPATGHQHTEVRNKTEATCTKEGYTGDTYCTDCGEKLSSGEVIPKKDHRYEEKERNEANCEREGYVLFICKTCGDEKREVLPKTDHQHTEVRNKEEATCTEGGYTGDTYCTDCGKKLCAGKETPATGHIHIGYLDKTEATCTKEGYTGDTYCKDCGLTLDIGEEIPATGHTWEKKSVIAPTYTKKGKITYICKRCKEKKVVTTKKLAYPKVGTKYTVSGSQYKVTKAGAEVSLIKTNKNAKSVTIPAVIKAKGVTYKVTSVAAKAVKNNKKVRSVVIGANVKRINNNAFYKCPALKTITIKTTKLTKKTASKKVFKGVGKKMVIKVPKKVKKSYAKIFKGLKVK